MPRYLISRCILSAGDEVVIDADDVDAAADEDIVDEVVGERE
jgi:hypothetical protein